MRRALLPTLVIAALGASGCDPQAPSPTDALQPPGSATLHKLDGEKNFRAHLNGRQEVPAVETRAQGQIKLQVDSDGESIRFKLIVANIEDVRMAHLHMAPAGQNGGVVVWLYPAGPPPQLIPGRFQGVLAEGEITEADLVGALAGQPLTALIDAMAAGNVYANVHTVANPGGEVRGQVRAGSSGPG